MDYTQKSIKTTLKGYLIRNIKAFFLALLLYVILVLIFYIVFYQKIIFPSSQSMETKITLNLQNFEPSKPAEVQSSIENDQEALAEATKELFEKIAKAS